MKHKTHTYKHVRVHSPAHTHTHTHTQKHPHCPPEVVSKYGTEQLDSTKINLRWCHPAAACTLSLALASLTNATYKYSVSPDNFGPAEFVLSWDDVYSWVVCFQSPGANLNCRQGHQKNWQALKHFNRTPQVIPLLFHFVGTNEYKQQIVQIALPTQVLFYVVNWITKSKHLHYKGFHVYFWESAETKQRIFIVGPICHSVCAVHHKKHRTKGHLMSMLQRLLIIMCPAGEQPQF